MTDDTFSRGAEQSPGETDPSTPPSADHMKKIRWSDYLSLIVPVCAPIIAASSVMLVDRLSPGQLSDVGTAMEHAVKLSVATVTVGYGTVAALMPEGQWTEARHRSAGRLWCVASWAALSWLALSLLELVRLLSERDNFDRALVASAVQITVVSVACVAFSVTTQRQRAPIAAIVGMAGMAAIALENEGPPLAVLLLAGHGVGAAVWAGGICAVVSAGLLKVQSEPRQSGLRALGQAVFSRMTGRTLLTGRTFSSSEHDSGVKTSDSGPGPRPDASTFADKSSTAQLAYQLPDPAFVTTVSRFSEIVAYPAFMITLFSGTAMWVSVTPNWTDALQDLLSGAWPVWASVKALITIVLLGSLGFLHRFGTVPALKAARVPGQSADTASDKVVSKSHPGRMLVILGIAEVTIMLFLVGVAGSMSTMEFPR